MNQSTYRTPSKGTGKYWLFNNGQFTERIEYTFQLQYQLAYRYEKVYVYRFMIMDNGVITNSCQVPLSSISNESERKICKNLFLEDQAKDIISRDYQFE